MLPKAPALQRMEELDGVGHEARRLLERVTGEILLAEFALVSSNPAGPGQLQKNITHGCCHDLASAGCS